MRFKAGEVYFREYIINDIDGQCLDIHMLKGHIIYADEEVFVVSAGPYTNAEVVNTAAINLKTCREYFPDVNYEFDQEGNPHADNFIPIDQMSESWLFEEGRTDMDSDDYLVKEDLLRTYTSDDLDGLGDYSFLEDEAWLDIPSLGWYIDKGHINIMFKCEFYNAEEDIFKNFKSIPPGVFFNTERYVSSAIYNVNFVVSNIKMLTFEFNHWKSIVMRGDYRCTLDLQSGSTVIIDASYFKDEAREKRYYKYNVIVKDEKSE